MAQRLTSQIHHLINPLYNHWLISLKIFAMDTKSLTHAVTSGLDNIRIQVKLLQGDATSLSNKVDIFESGLQIQMCDMDQGLNC